ncbi:hypothetical protein PGTUg99_017373 [Puccinia graminis f. sp. tritici]|uniref:Uncharacterized protein n=1 Tax=Puccinia graminis f. sp. tritici TaxID=56615 RepID=A0A5B0S0R8_PUCGR|nr:hypothetical protein PGTUg99_017373 [Puccinia graminis f. sp. tritici]
MSRTSNLEEPLDPQETPWSSFIVRLSGFTPDRCKRPLRPLRTLGNRSLASEQPPDPRIQLGTALRPSFDELHPPRPSDPNGSSETIRSGPQILGSSSERPSDRPLTPATPQAIVFYSDRPQDRPFNPGSSQTLGFSSERPQDRPFIPKGSKPSEGPLDGPDHRRRPQRTL